jgi:DNA-binding transcriptional ArsR family regulator
VSQARRDEEARAEAVFEALADGTRRAVLRQVAERGPVTATELATGLPVSRQAIAKHLAVLRGAGLVDQERAGRETRFSADTGPMVDASRWLEATGAAWDDRLGRLAARLEQRARARGGPPERE